MKWEQLIDRTGVLCAKEKEVYRPQPDVFNARSPRKSRSWEREVEKKEHRERTQTANEVQQGDVGTYRRCRLGH